MICFFLPIIIISCTEEMDDFDLRTADAKFVIDANLTPNKAEVILSKTTSYLNPTEIPYVSGAKVSISDGNQDFLLEETTVGHYTISNNFETEIEYSLFVKIDNQEFTAKSYLSKPVLWDSSYVALSELDKLIASDDTTEHLYEINGYITDPAPVTNFYKIDMYFEDTLRDWNVVSDKNFSGKSCQILSSNEFKSPHDTLYFLLKTIDKSIYEFYVTLANCNSSSTMSAAPDNPKTNILGGALGRFSAYSLDSLMIIIPKYKE